MDAERRSAGLSQSDVGRGIALRRAMTRALDGMRQVPGPKAGRWPILLEGLYIEGRSAEYLMDSMGIARSTYDHDHAAALDALIRQMMALDVAAESPAARGPGVPRLAPPLPLHPILGRDALLAQVRSRLISSRRPAVAIWGAPGAGKTTFAVAVASDAGLGERFPDGVLWAGLGQHPDPAAILGLFAGVMGIPWAETGRWLGWEDRARLVRSAVGERRMLIVLDDAWELEHVRTLSIAGPNCGLLVTTRDPSLARDLSEGEPVFVPSLPSEDSLALLSYFVPELGGPRIESGRDLAAAAGGLPLALVLIGRSLRQEASLASPERFDASLQAMMEPASRLQIALPPLESDSRPDLPEGAPLSLPAVVGLSESRLDESRRKGFWALGVLPPEPGSFSEAAAQAVGDIDEEDLRQLHAVGLLEPAGGGRYRMHPTVSDYARLRGEDGGSSIRLVRFVHEWLAKPLLTAEAFVEDLHLIQGALEGARHGPADLFLDLAISLFAPVERASAWDWVEPYWLEAENLARQLFDQERLLGIQSARAVAALHLANYTDAECFAMEALMLSLECDDASRAAQMFQTLGAVAFNRGDLVAAESSYRNGLRQAEEEGLQGELCGLLANLASVFAARGENEEAASLLSQALDLARGAGDSHRQASILMNAGVVAARQGELQEAALRFEESLELSSVDGSWEQRVFLLTNLGTLDSERGCYPEAVERFEQALDLARRLVDRVRVSLLLGNLGALWTLEGSYLAAADALNEGTMLAREIGQSDALCLNLTNTGVLHLKQGALEQAEPALREAVSVSEELGQPRLQAAAQCAFAQVLLGMGKPGEASPLFASSLDLATSHALPVTQAEAYFGLANVAYLGGQPWEAIELAKESLSLLLSMSHPLHEEVEAWIASHEASGI